MKGLTKRFAQEKHGLPGYQAEIFASAKFNDQAGLDAGYKGLRESLAQRDSSGEILRNSSGEAILSEKDNRFALSMYKDIYNAGVHQGSKDGQSGPILKDVKAWNATQNTPGK
jgi:conjugal transfer mating pair stabilization protein TraG